MFCIAIKVIKCLFVSIFQYVLSVEVRISILSLLRRIFIIKNAKINHNPNLESSLLARIQYLRSFYLPPGLGVPHLNHCTTLGHAQLQSATKQLSDEQHPASHEQSGHPEFPQSQPITKSATPKLKIAIYFFILFIYYTKMYLLYPHQALLSTHFRRLTSIHSP